VVSVKFDDAAVAQFFDQQVDAGRKPAQFARIWIHTHPEMSAEPSLTDEETFARVFGRADWAVMFIVSKTDDVFCRLRFNVGPGGDLELRVHVAYDQPFGGSDIASWEAEYQAHVNSSADVLKAAGSDNLLAEVVSLRPGQATDAVLERIAQASRSLATQGWTQAAVTDAIRSGKHTIEQLLELADSPEAGSAAEPEAQLRECLEREWGWSSADIDQQLQLGWTLRELVDGCEWGDFEPATGSADESRGSALFTVEP